MTITDNTIDSRVHDHGFDPPATGVKSWSADRVALLIDLREQGVARQAIAAIINEQTGSKFTKPAVCGKIDRIFPAERPRKTPEEKAAAIRAQRDRDNAKKRLRTRQKRLEAGLPFDMSRRAPRVYSVVKFVKPQPSDRNIHGVANLDDGRCHYIINDDTSAPIYCGSPVVKDKSWCASCCQIVFRPVEQRRAA